MYLISTGFDTRRYWMREFIGDKIPQYAILSHTWGDNEVSFRDMQHLNEEVKAKEGFKKIAYTCDEAASHDISWAWVDTCCIDKSSSAELSEAINSMYAWYRNAARCYTYLIDVPPDDDPFAEQSAFRRSRWFTRSWTLQELIAPGKVEFYDTEWQYIGRKCRTESNSSSSGGRFVKLLEEITGIPEGCLVNHSPSSYSVAKRMSWASKRECTRVEDIAYSLIGLFGVNMPLLYGEGANAFLRLQEEIMREIDDHSLFAWTIPRDKECMVSSVFAQSPANFARSSDIIPNQEEARELSLMTKKGLRISLDLRPIYSRTRDDVPTVHLGILNCGRDGAVTNNIALLLIPDTNSMRNQPRSFYRCAMAEHIFCRLSDHYPDIIVYIHKKIQLESSQTCREEPLRRLIFPFVDRWPGRFPFARISKCLEEYREAEALHYRLLNRSEKKFDLLTQRSIDTLAFVLRRMCRYEDPEALYHQIQDRADKRFKKIFTFSTDFDVLLYPSGRDEAEELFEDKYSLAPEVLRNLVFVLRALLNEEDPEAINYWVWEEMNGIIRQDHPIMYTVLFALLGMSSIAAEYSMALSFIMASALPWFYAWVVGLSVLRVVTEDVTFYTAFQYTRRSRK